MIAVVSLIFGLIFWAVWWFAIGSDEYGRRRR